MDLAGLAPRGKNGRNGPAAARDVWYRDGWRETPVHRRDDLPPGTGFSGPAIVEQLDTTTVIEPECDVIVDAAGNLVVTVGALAEDRNEAGP